MGYDAVKRAAVAAILAAVPFLPLQVTAKDLGTVARVYDIVEVDLRQALLESASRVDWGTYTKKLKENATSFTKRLPQRNLPYPSNTKTVWIDPTVEMKEDYWGVTKNEAGEYVWSIIVPKGTKANPIEINRPSTAMLFFNANDERQWETVKKLMASRYHDIVFSSTSGDVDDLSKKVQKPVFYVPDYILDKFSIEETPVLLYAGTGAHSLHLGTTFFARDDFTPESIERVFPLKSKGSPLK